MGVLRAEEEPRPFLLAVLPACVDMYRSSWVCSVNVWRCLATRSAVCSSPSRQPVGIHG